jgi:hypothetical protein
MKRRFNYTGRKKIGSDRISITLVHDENNEIQSFNARINLGDMKLPIDANVYIDAYHKTESKRFDFGNVINLSSRQETTLVGLAYAGQLKFKVVVVDKSAEHGKILAIADEIHPTAAPTKSILPVFFKDIGQRIWMLDFSGSEGAPVLLINKKIPNIENIAKSNPQFIMFVYPSVIKEILIKIIFIDRVDSINDPSIDWHRDWLDFSKMTYITRSTI